MSNTTYAIASANRIGLMGPGQASTVTRAADHLPLENVPILASYTVAELTTLTAAAYSGALVRCSDGDTGSPCLALSDGTDWLRIVLGAAVASS
jgi:hypothetical protein